MRIISVESLPRLIKNEMDKKIIYFSKSQNVRTHCKVKNNIHTVIIIVLKCSLCQTYVYRLQVLPILVWPFLPSLLIDFSYSQVIIPDNKFEIFIDNSWTQLCELKCCTMNVVLTYTLHTLIGMDINEHFKWARYK